MVKTEENERLFPTLEGGEIEESELTPRDSGVLQAIRSEGLTVFTFDGLKRLLGVHQETLSRVLDRLEDEGMIEKVVEGYRLTLRGSELVAQPLGSANTRIPIVQSLLPADLDIGRVFSGLKGRWFGSLRWLGYSQNEEGLILKWITDEEGIQVDANFTGNVLSIEARVPEGSEVGQAIKASHQLLGYISRLYGRPRQGRRFAAPVAFYPGLTFA